MGERSRALFGEFRAPWTANRERVGAERGGRERGGRHRRLDGDRWLTVETATDGAAQTNLHQMAAHDRSTARLIVVPVAGTDRVAVLVGTVLAGLVPLPCTPAVLAVVEEQVAAGRQALVGARVDRSHGYCVLDIALPAELELHAAA